MKKKILLGIGVGIILTLVIVVVVVGFFLGDVVKAGMETVGPKVTQTTLMVGAVHIDILTGGAAVNKLVLGNPEGYTAQAPNAITVGKAAVNIVPGSLLSDKIIIQSVEVRDAEIFFDGKLPLFTENNLKKIQDNVNAFVGTPAQPAAANANAPAKAKPAKKLEVDDFLITGAKVHFKGATLPLPSIHLTHLGTGPDGITPAELIKDVLGEITTATVKAVVSSVGDAGKAIGNEAGKAIKSLGGLFGK